MKGKVIVIGGGLAGLTVAHELLNKGFHVSLYEKQLELGGMAHSLRETFLNIPTEHSWRAYGDFYDNVYDIMKQIPYKNGSVYENLTKINFLSPKKEISNDDYTPNYTFTDAIWLIYYVLMALMSNNRRNTYAKQSFIDLLDNKLSKSGKDLTISYFGPGLGLHIERTSLYDIANYIELAINAKDNKGFRVLTGPTNEIWIDTWVEYLINKGLDLHLGSELTDIKINNGKVSEIYVKGVNKIVGDYYVLALNPYELRKILEKSPINDTEIMKIMKITEESPHLQISFQIGFTESINLPQKDTVLNLVDSEYGITLYSQERFWRDDIFLGEGIKGLWSGTCTICKEINGKLYGKPAYKLTKSELIDEILFQLKNTKELNKMISENNNGKVFNDFQIKIIVIPKEWHYNHKKEELESELLKWVTSLQTYGERPKQKTGISNLFLAGAHTETSVDVWSMEGAVESGKIVSKYIDPSVNVFIHESPEILKLFKWGDDVLYALGLPNILNFIMILIFVIFIGRMVK